MNNKNLQNLGTKTKIVALWTAPRCLSTVCEKVFSQRPDTVTIHEPFLYTYYYSQWRRSDRFGDRKEYLNYGAEKIIEHINSQTTPLVFIKEMAYHTIPYIEREFLNSNIVNTFLVRNPKKSLLSWYKLNEFPTEEEFGFDSLNQMWQIVTEELKQKPIVIEADCVQSDPAKTFQYYCQNVDIKFVPEVLNWNQGRIKQENSLREEIHTKWHQTLGSSTRILPPTEATGEIRSQDMPMLERAMDVYQQLAQFAL
ncbi:MAG: sulfotransferase family protein [Cyanobacteria bacterium P01_D01_bin.50]